jgi:dUTP pyrophosphatase
MKVKIKRFDHELPLPEYKTPGSVAMDLSARVTTEIPPRSMGYVPMNIAVQIPDGYWVLVAARSSLHKKGLMLGNGIGVGDTDFCGDQDEYKAILFNFTDNVVVVEKGERIAQMMVLKREPMELEEVEHLSEKNRGGIGSTGTR